MGEELEMPGSLAGVGVVVLAAGRGTRMGGPKALMVVRGRPWWQWQSERLAAAAAVGAAVYWVCSVEVMRAMEGARLPGRLVAGDSGAAMFGSVRVGLEAAAAVERDGGQRLRGVLVLPVDVPGAGVATMERLVEAGRDGPVAPAHQGVRGHPVWLNREWILRVFETAVAVAGGGGAADASLRLDGLLAGGLRMLEVEDASVVVNLNTPKDVEAWVGSGL